VRCKLLALLRCLVMQRGVAVFLALALTLGCRPVPIGPDGTPVPAPHNLDQAMDTLDRLLEPEPTEAVRSGKIELIELYPGIGAWVADNWGRWALARWFRVRGIKHPEDMSAIILESYTRRLRGQPIELRAQIDHYKRYWAEQRAYEKAERAAGRKRAALVEAERMGWTVVDRDVPILPALDVPEQTDTSVPVARLEHYAGGVLVFADHVYGEPPQLWPKWHTGVYYLADPSAELEWVRRDDCEHIHDALTLGDTTHWLCRNGESWVVLDETAGEVSFRSLDIDAEFLRLGSHGDELLVIGPRTIHRFDRGAWRTVFESDEAWFPERASVPRQLGDHLFYFTLGSLVRTDLRDGTLDQDWKWEWELLREHYGRWENQCYMLTPSSSGGLWLTAGQRFYSTLFHLRPNAVEVAVFAGSVDRPAKYDNEGMLIHTKLGEAKFRQQIPTSAVLERDGVVYLADELGIAVSRAGRVEPLVRFNVPYSWSKRSTGRSLGPRELALFPGPRPSFALLAWWGELAVVRASEDGYELRWPKRASVAIMK
jgi:hypothetical protein